jgi:hypothetical protein
MGTERPALDNDADPEDFMDHYYLKEELIIFCRQNGLRTSGGKAELTERAYRFLLTGERAAGERVSKRTLSGEVTADTVIGQNDGYSQKLRAFFEENIGGSFKFSVEFQKWLRSNHGRTYGDAVTAYRDLQKGKARTEIGKQFRYNTYIRDFFDDNPGRTLKDAIKCWRYKKNLPGDVEYERSDLDALL